MAFTLAGQPTEVSHPSGRLRHSVSQSGKLAGAPGICCVDSGSEQGRGRAERTGQAPRSPQGTAGDPALTRRCSMPRGLGALKEEDGPRPCPGDSPWATLVGSDCPGLGAQDA